MERTPAWFITRDRDKRSITMAGEIRFVEHDDGQEIIDRPFVAWLPAEDHFALGEHVKLGSPKYGVADYEIIQISEDQVRVEFRGFEDGVEPVEAAPKKAPAKKAAAKAE